MGKLSFDNARMVLTRVTNPLSIIAIANFIDVMEKLDEARIVTTTNALYNIHSFNKYNINEFALMCATERLPEFRLMIQPGYNFENTFVLFPWYSRYNASWSANKTINEPVLQLTLDTTEDEIINKLFNYIDCKVQGKYFL